MFFKHFENIFPASIIAEKSAVSLLFPWLTIYLSFLGILKIIFLILVNLSFPMSRCGFLFVYPIGICCASPNILSINYSDLRNTGRLCSLWTLSGNYLYTRFSNITSLYFLYHLSGTLNRSHHRLYSLQIHLHVFLFISMLHSGYFLQIFFSSSWIASLAVPNLIYWVFMSTVIIFSLRFCSCFFFPNLPGWFFSNNNKTPRFMLPLYTHPLYWDITDIQHCIKVYNIIWSMYILQNDYHSKFNINYLT